MKQKGDLSLCWKGERNRCILSLSCVSGTEMFPCFLPSFLQSYKIGGIKPTLHRLGSEGYDEVTEAGPLEVTGGFKLEVSHSRALCIPTSVLPQGWVIASVATCLCSHDLLWGENKERDHGRERLREHLEVGSSS